jgi:hypothetical protein
MCQAGGDILQDALASEDELLKDMAETMQAILTAAPSAA